MNIPTEPLGSIPRPMPLIEALAETGDHSDPALDSLYEEAIRDTIEEFDGISRSTLIWLRSENPSTYQRSAEARPAIARRGGCRRRHGGSRS